MLFVICLKAIKKHLVVCIVTVQYLVVIIIIHNLTIQS